MVAGRSLSAAVPIAVYRQLVFEASHLRFTNESFSKRIVSRQHEASRWGWSCFQRLYSLTQRPRCSGVRRRGIIKLECRDERAKRLHPRAKYRCSSMHSLRVWILYEKFNRWHQNTKYTISRNEASILNLNAKQTSKFYRFTNIKHRIIICFVYSFQWGWTRFWRAIHFIS